MSTTLERPLAAIPATVLTGFLGAGKTTFLNYLLKEQNQYKVAVIINEIGAVNIDHGLVEWNEDSVVEMSNGCICCTIRTDLIQGIVNLLKRSKFDYLVIETTGLADPGPVAQTFLNVPELHSFVKLDSIITLVDAVNFFDQAKASPTTDAQVEVADFIILNKVDLADADQLRKVKKRLNRLNPHATIYEATNGRIDLSLIWDVHAFNLDAKLAVRPNLLDETIHYHDETIKPFTLTYEQPFSLPTLEKWIQDLSTTTHILRSKGIVQIEGSDRRIVFHGVNDRYSLYWDRPWKEDEERKSVMVFIGTDLPKQQIEDGLKKCIATEKTAA